MADDNVVYLHTPIADEITKVFEEYDDILIIGSNDSSLAVVSNVGAATGVILMEAAKMQLVGKWAEKDV